VLTLLVAPPTKLTSYDPALLNVAVAPAELLEVP
jgi:hypothetical protein